MGARTPRESRARRKNHGLIHFDAGIFHFLGEIEAVFGILAIALVGAMVAFYDWHTAVFYLSHKVN